MKVALYARYSTDLQSDKSVEDQFRILTDYATKQGWVVVQTYADRALSGTHLASRPGAMQMLNDVRSASCKWDLLLSEAWDRIARDSEHSSHIYKAFEFANKGIYTLTEGAINEVQVAVKSIVASFFTKDLRTKIRRGQKGSVERGRQPGGLSYGYDVVAALDSNGELQRGGRKINEREAEVIRRIFREYGAGTSPRAIAAGLNKDGIKAPRSNRWTASGINGVKRQGTGILWNRLYIGQLTYNRATWVKDPDTGKRKQRPNPPQEWTITEVPELRIVDDELWQAAQKRKAKYEARAPHQQRRPKHLFAGLVKCGVCGGGYTIVNYNRLQCSARRETGACTNNRIIRTDDLERRVLTAIKDKLLTPELVYQATEMIMRERAEQAGEWKAQRDEYERRIYECTLYVGKVNRLFEKDQHNDAMLARAKQCEAEAKELKQQIAVLDELDQAVQVNPNAPQTFRKTIRKLMDGLVEAEDGSQVKPEISAILRGLVGHIDIHPLNQRGQTSITLHGDILGLTSLANWDPSRPLTQLAAESRFKVVAEEGFEPPTQGL